MIKTHEVPYFGGYEVEEGRITVAFVVIETVAVVAQLIVVCCCHFEACHSNVIRGKSSHALRVHRASHASVNSPLSKYPLIQSVTSAPCLLPSFHNMYHRPLLLARRFVPRSQSICHGLPSQAAAAIQNMSLKTPTKSQKKSQTMSDNEDNRSHSREIVDVDDVTKLRQQFVGEVDLPEGISLCHVSGLSRS